MDRIQTRGEEWANSISHGIGFLGSIAVTPLLILSAIPYGPAFITGVSIFGFTMMVLYLASTLYHALRGGKAKRIFLTFDHAAIFLLVAGTYTPFTLGTLYGAWGWSLFGLVWGMALFGILLKILWMGRLKRISTGLYLGMGWLAVIAVKPLWINLPFWGIFWLVMGGVLYSAGVLFFRAEKLPYHHLIWHLFVLAGTACHVVAVMAYSFPD